MKLRLRRTTQTLLALALLAGVAAAAGVWYLHTVGVAPRALAMYIGGAPKGTGRWWPTAWVGWRAC
jgi:hypothetical protein